MTRRQHATYVYCLVEADRPPSPARAPKGIPRAGPVRPLDTGDGIWAVVADAPLSGYGEKAIERGLADLEWVSKVALAHEAVVEHFARSSAAVVPMKLFTLFRDDGRAVAHVQAERRRIRKVLDRVRGCAEFGVRLVLDEAAALESVEGAASSQRATGGAGYLIRKRALRQASNEISAVVWEGAEALFETLARCAVGSTRRAPVAAPAGRRHLLDAAFLVRQSRARSFLAAAKRASRRLERCGCEVVVTGPWPPYHFAA